MFEMGAIRRSRPAALGRSSPRCALCRSIVLLAWLSLAAATRPGRPGLLQAGERQSAGAESPGSLAREGPGAEPLEPLDAAGRAVLDEEQGPAFPQGRARSRVLKGLRAASLAAPKEPQSPVGTKWTPSLGWTLVWPQVDVMTRGGPSGFGWVETASVLTKPAVVGQQTCVWVAAKDDMGNAFEGNGTAQRAYFVARIRQADIVLLAQVWYLPTFGIHKMCYTLPAPGQYTLQLQLGYVNYNEYVSRIDRANAAGFAGYTTVLYVTVKASASAAMPGGSPGSTAANASAALLQSRAQLPICTLASLAQNRNLGFWKGNSWFPLSCRLAQLSQADMAQCLNGKSVLIIGDSEVRILFGLLQEYFKYNSRAEFLSKFTTIPRSMGDLLGNFKLPLTTSDGGEGPPLAKGTTKAVKTRIDYENGDSTFYGGIYQGFTIRQVSMKTASNKLIGSFNVTYSSYFNSSQPLFSAWKLAGAQSDGVKVTTSGIPFDSVVMSTQIHDTWFFQNVTTYHKAVTTNLLPTLQTYLKDKTSLVMYGGLAGIESRTPGSSLNFAGNPRAAVFEAMGRQILTNRGYPNFFPLQQMTAARPDLARDSIHYTWPVTLTMIDMWLGGLCPQLGKAQ